MSLPSAFCRALGKGFAECQKTLGKEKHSEYKSKKIQKNKIEKKEFIRGGMHIQLVTHLMGCTFQQFFIIYR
jgi:hypothetical protein